MLKNILFDISILKIINIIHNHKLPSTYQLQI